LFPLSLINFASAEAVYGGSHRLLRDDQS